MCTPFLSAPGKWGRVPVLPLVLGSVVPLCAAASSLAQQVSFNPLGGASISSWSHHSSWSIGAAVSPDGTTAAAKQHGVYSGDGVHPFLWDSQNLYQPLGLMPDQQEGHPMRFSSDGSALYALQQDSVNTSSNVKITRWDLSAGTWSTVSDVGYMRADWEATGMTADGSALLFNQGTAPEFDAYFWTPADGPQRIDSALTNVDYSRGYDITSDGSVIVGSVTFHGSGMSNAFYWTRATGMRLLDSVYGSDWSVIATAVSADGSVVVGAARKSGVVDVFRWTEGTGMVSLGSPSATLTSYKKLLVSGDGSTIAVSLDWHPAFFWTQHSGFRGIKDILSDGGVDMSTWLLDEVDAISYDGLSIVGTGWMPEGNREAWMATIPEPATLCLLALGLPLLKRRRKC